MEWAVDDVPGGWAICDGTLGTPDLRGRFVLGASDEYVMGNPPGGEKEHTLTVEEMPSHFHKTYAVTTGGSNSWVGTNLSFGVRTKTDSAGGDQPHNNMPPYYILAYIMKL